MPKAKGVAAFRREYGRLKQLVPDLRGKVLNWSNQGRGLLWIELSLQGHLKGVPIAWQTVDKIQLNTEGLCISLQAYFDPLPLLMICLKNKVTWGPLLRSGLVWGMLKSLKAESIPSSEGCSAKY